MKVRAPEKVRVSPLVCFKLAHILRAKLTHLPINNTIDFFGALTVYYISGVAS